MKLPGTQRRTIPLPSPRSWAHCLLAAALAAVTGCRAAPVADPPAARPSVVRGQLVIESDVPIENLEPLLAELVLLRDDVLGELALPRVQRPIFLRIFAGAETLDQHTRDRFPTMSGRRAYFVDDSGLLTVYVSAGPRLAEDLRHEVSHGYLHAAVPEIPIWVDEGLAEYYEVGGSLQGWHTAHAELLRGELALGAWRPDLARLERITSVDQMTQLDYAECWAWVYFLLRADSQNAAVLRDELELLRTGQAPPLFSAELARRIYRPERALRDWLEGSVDGIR